MLIQHQLTVEKMRTSVFDCMTSISTYDVKRGVAQEIKIARQRDLSFLKDTDGQQAAIYQRVRPHKRKQICRDILLNLCSNRGHLLENFIMSPSQKVWERRGTLGECV